MGALKLVHQLKISHKYLLRAEGKKKCLFYVCISIKIEILKFGRYIIHHSVDLQHEGS